MMLERKTKAELMELIDQKNEEIVELKEEVNKLEKYKQYDDMADEVKAIHDSFIHAGFTENQAFILLGQFINASGNMAAKPRFPF